MFFIQVAGLNSFFLALTHLAENINQEFSFWGDATAPAASTADVLVRLEAWFLLQPLPTRK